MKYRRNFKKLRLLLLLLPFFLAWNQSARAETWSVRGADGDDTLAVLTPDWQTLPLAKFHLEKAGLDVLAAGRLLVIGNDQATFPPMTRTAQKKTPLGRYPERGKHRALWLYQYRDLGTAMNTLHDWQTHRATWKKHGIEEVQIDLLPLREPWPKEKRLNIQLNTNQKKFQLSDYLSLQDYWKFGKGESVNVAIIDDGVWSRHPLFAHVKTLDSWDMDADEKDTQTSAKQYHGNEMAAVLWGIEMPEMPGIAPDAGLISLRLTRPWTSNLLRTFMRAERYGADVINASWLLPWVSGPLRDYIRYLTRDARQGTGIAIVAAAHPQYVRNIGLAALPEVIVVSSVDYSDQLANASWDEHTDIAASGFVLSYSFNRNQYRQFGKTSISTVLVSGLTALIRQIQPKMSVAEIETALKETARPHRLSVTDGELAYRSLDARALLATITKRAAEKSK